jgi:hypothetical protein
MKPPKKLKEERKGGGSRKRRNRTKVHGNQDHAAESQLGPYDSDRNQPAAKMSESSTNSFQQEVVND